jgi:hypothetical protein
LQKVLAARRELAGTRMSPNVVENQSSICTKEQIKFSDQASKPVCKWGWMDAGQSVLYGVKLGVVYPDPTQ